MELTRRVIIVEEDARVRHAIRRLCEFEGLAVREAGSAAASETLATVFGPDVAIIGNVLSYADGEAAAALIRAVSPGTKVIAFSDVLNDCPAWADSHLGKMDLLRMTPLLQEFR